MTIPDAERDELQRRRYAAIEAGEESENLGASGPRGATVR